MRPLASPRREHRPRGDHPQRARRRYPDPVRAAEIAVMAGADGITAHLREDRRHISDDDIAPAHGARSTGRSISKWRRPTRCWRSRSRHRPHAACLVPERREERTTEGGLDVAGQHNHAHAVVAAAAARPASASRCSSKPIAAQIDAAARRRRARWSSCTPAPIARRRRRRSPTAAARARTAACDAAPRQAAALGLEVPRRPRPRPTRPSAPIAAIPEIVELNIGHFLIGEAIFVGLEAAIRRMRALMDEARAPAEPSAP